MDKKVETEFESDISKLDEGLDKVNEKASRLVSLLREAETIISFTLLSRFCL